MGEKNLDLEKVKTITHTACVAILTIVAAACCIKLTCSLNSMIGGADQLIQRGNNAMKALNGSRVFSLPLKKLKTLTDEEEKLQNGSNFDSRSNISFDSNSNINDLFFAEADIGDLDEFFSGNTGSHSNENNSDSDNDDFDPDDLKKPGLLTMQGLKNFIKKLMN